MTGNINEFFTWQEAMCRGGSPVPNELQNDVRYQAALMRKLRLFFDAPITINSWYRTPEYNAKVAGKPNSIHLKGLACDFTVKGYKPAQVAAAIEGLTRCGTLPEGGLGLYKTFVHWDSRGTRARWKG